VKNVTMLVWLTQLGLSVAVPPACFVLLALWLRDSCGWGGWVLWAGILLGIYSAVMGFVSSLRTMERMSRDKQQDKPVSFNDHN